MTPDESSVVHSIGQDLVQGFVAIAHETLWLGIYGTVVVQACLVLLSKKRRGVRGSQVNLAAVIAMFAIATVQWALDLAGFIIEGKMTLIENPDADIGVKYGDASGVIFKIVAAQAAIYGYMALLGDAIIIHRAWKLKATHHVWIFAVPCLLWLGSVVATLLLTYCVATIGSDIVLGNFTHPAFCRNVQLVTYVMPCATTAVATALIGAMALKFARTRKSIGHVDRVSSVGTVHKSPAWYVLLLLVESGVLYFLFFLIQVIEVAPVVHNWLAANAGLSLAFKMFVYASSVFIGIYPTILIVLAHSRYAVLDQVAAKTSSSAYSYDTARPVQHSIAPHFSAGTVQDISTFHVQVRGREEGIELADVVRGDEKTDAKNGHREY
ncbi:unnamed protein product [Mycena citricolor]|uniref:Uncharacterized protein n=1 Tax=Mycena citricolor TaxID=2018698 RepID=A0AAD2GYR6_9AGAR|nr:unnamed protein product [Mycena citricolor]